jgi:hypothetical protein
VDPPESAAKAEGHALALLAHWLRFHRISSRIDRSSRRSWTEMP